MRDLRNYSLLYHNTFGIDVSCRRFVEFETKQELLTVLSTFTEHDKPIMSLGEGSNLLLTHDYDGTILHSAIRFMTIDVDGDVAAVRSGSGVIWDDLVSACVNCGAYGMENLSLIPGTVGAAAVQNIGAYGTEVKDFISDVWAVEIATGKTYRFSAADCRYAYRQSRFKTEWKDRFVITAVDFSFDCTFRPHVDYGNIREELQRQGIAHPTPRQLRDTIIAIRRAKLPDPSVTGNAGSFFMNPVVSRAKFEELLSNYPQMPHYTIDEQHEKIPAGWLIEQCGWKGRTVGAAGVHDKQALVLVNRGGATGNDIVQLCRSIQHDVSQRFGITISPEVNIL